MITQYQLMMKKLDLMFILLIPKINLIITSQTNPFLTILKVNAFQKIRLVIVEHAIM